MGEPVALTAPLWEALARDALVYFRRGRPTDAAVIVPARDARRLVLRALGEAAPADGGACSALEERVLERILGRCGEAFEPLCGPGAFARVDASTVPGASAYVDLRVREPLALTVGIATTRPLAEPPPARTLGAEPLAGVTLEARAVFAEGMVSAADFVRLRPGHVVKLETKVGAPASLNVAGRRLAEGVAGVVASRTAFLVHDVATGAHG